MANFLGVFDPVEKRRNKYFDKCKSEIKLFDNLKFGTLSIGNFSLQWAVSQKAPFAFQKGPTECNLVFGDAICTDSEKKIKARQLKDDWKDIENAKKNYYDGYYCGIHYSQQNGLIVGGDILGLFPIYYFKGKEITLVGSSPELFKHHPGFTPGLNTAGLTATLLLMHSTSGLSLWNNVHRLKAGHLLFDQAGKNLQEIKQYQLPFSDKYFDITFNKQLEIAHQKMENAVKRHAPDDQAYSFLLSGGLDSRMLAGYLKNRKNISAITIGKPSDHEMKIATKVVNHLPFPHKTFTIPFNRYREYAQLTAKWEHGLNGFNTIHSWNYNTVGNATKPSRMISGILHDGVFMGGNLDTIDLDKTPRAIFEDLFKRINRWGIAISDVKELLNDNYTHNIQVIYDKLLEEYLNYADSAPARNWSSHMYNRARFHQGGAIWKMSFGAWPVIPVLDSSTLEFMAGLPCATKSGRRLERELVSTYFPKLARLPLDSNSFISEPLSPTWQHLLFKSLMQNDLLKKLYYGSKNRIFGSKNERLYYYRIYDINNTGWKSIRKLAAPSRSYTDHLFNQEKLSQLLPGPDEELDAGIGDASGMKSLLGFMIWLENNQKTF